MTRGQSPISPLASIPDVVIESPCYSCSFCGKSEAEVRHIVLGPRAYICDECVAFCVEELRDHGVDVGVIDVRGAEVSS